MSTFAARAKLLIRSRWYCAIHLRRRGVIFLEKISWKRSEQPVDHEEVEGFSPQNVARLQWTIFGIFIRKSFLQHFWSIDMCMSKNWPKISTNYKATRFMIWFTLYYWTWSYTCLFSEWIFSNLVHSARGSRKRVFAANRIFKTSGIVFRWGSITI